MINYKEKYDSFISHIKNGNITEAIYILEQNIQIFFIYEAQIKYEIGEIVSDKFDTKDFEIYHNQEIFLQQVQVFAQKSIIEDDRVDKLKNLLNEIFNNKNIKEKDKANYLIKLLNTKDSEVIEDLRDRITVIIDEKYNLETSLEIDVSDNEGIDSDHNTYDSDDQNIDYSATYENKINYILNLTHPKTTKQYRINNIGSLIHSYKQTHLELLDAIKNCKLDKIDEILRNDISHIYIAPVYTKDLLEFSVKYGNKKALKHLLVGWNIDNKRKEFTGNIINAARYAAGHGCLDSLKFLIFEMGYDINSEDARGWSLLHYAAINNCENIVEFLLSENAFVDAQNIENETPLHFAVRENNKAITLKLLLNGADEELENQSNISPRKLAEENKIMDGLFQFYPQACYMVNEYKIVNNSKISQVIHLAYKKKGFTEITLSELEALKLYKNVYTIFSIDSVKLYIDSCIEDRKQIIKEKLLEPKMIRYFKEMAMMKELPIPIFKSIKNYLDYHNDGLDPHDNIVDLTRVEIASKYDEYNDLKKEYEIIKSHSNKDKKVEYSKLLNDRIPKLDYKDSLGVRDTALKICNELERLLHHDAPAKHTNKVVSKRSVTPVKAVRLTNTKRLSHIEKKESSIVITNDNKQDDEIRKLIAETREYYKSQAFSHAR